MFHFRKNDKQNRCLTRFPGSVSWLGRLNMRRLHRSSASREEACDLKTPTPLEAVIDET